MPRYKKETAGIAKQTRTMNKTFVIRNRSLDALTDDQIGRMAMFKFGISRK